MTSESRQLSARSAMRYFLLAIAAAAACTSGCDQPPTATNPPLTGPGRPNDTPADPPGGTGQGVRRVPGGKPIESYDWLAAADFLGFRERQRTDAVRKNADSGEETPLPELSKRLRASL